MMLRSFFIGLAVAAFIAGCSGSDAIAHDDDDSPAAGGGHPRPSGANDSVDAATSEAGADGAAVLRDAGDAKATNDAQTLGIGTDASAACTPIFPPGTACSDCINDRCTTELAVCNGDCDCLAAYACDTDCLMNNPANDFVAIDACMNVCEAKHPAGSAKFLTLAKCSHAECSASSDGGTGACS